MNESRPSVTIIGAGIAGMSAALRLLQVGCPVTVIEKADHVGGQFGAVEVGSRYHEHAFHIFADWCQNFFAICKELGLKHPPDYQGDPEAAFEPRPVFLTLQPLPTERQTFESMRGPRGREVSDFKRLEYLGAPEYFWKNANAGVAHWSDMVIYQYSVLDMLSDHSLEDDTKAFLNRVSVNGFMNSRGYASDIAALLHHELLLKVFAVPSYRTSARSYQTYLRHTAAFPPGQPMKSDPSQLSPSFWAMRGNVHETFWVKFLQKLEDIAKAKGVRFDIRYREVTGLTLAKSAGGNRVTHIQFGKQTEEVPDQLLVAVPLTGFKNIIKNSPDLATVAPELLDVRYLEAVPVPALNLYFNKKLALPKEHMTLLDSKDDFYAPDPSLARRNGIASKYGLSLVDHSQLWPTLSPDKTVLSVLAADSTLLMAESDETVKRLVLETLRQYIYFDPGDFDRKEEDIHLQKDRHEPLFVNTEGSWEYRPEARLDEGSRTFPRVRDKVANLALAGDYCRSKVDIVSVEGAIVTGICAARLICGEVPAPKEPPPDFEREAVRRAKAVLDGWIDLATRRSKQNALTERAHVKEKATRS